MTRILIVFLLCIMAVGVGAQTPLTGRVLTKPDGEPAVGATVVVKGTTNGTFSDIDGRFSIKVPVGDVILVISYTGYETREIAVGTRTNLEVLLEEHASNLG